MTTYNGTSGIDSLFGGSGDDIFNMYGGDDYAHAGAGDDTMYGGSGDDELLGEEGSDRIFGGSEEDTLFGMESADTLDGGNDRDLLYGSAGADVLDGASGGSDELYGGDGADTFRWDSGTVGQFAFCGGDEGDRDTVIASNVTDVTVGDFHETQAADGDRFDWMSGRSGTQMDTDSDGILEFSDSTGGLFGFTISSNGSGGMLFFDEPTGTSAEFEDVNNQMYAVQII